MDNRQVATLAWMAAFGIWALTSPPIRRSVHSAVRVFMNPKILAFFVVMTSWVASLIVVASRFGVWGPELLFDTLVWFLGPAMVLLGNSYRLLGPGRLGTTLRGIVAWTVLVEFYVGIAVLPLLLELLLIPILVLGSLVEVQAAGSTDEEPVRRVAAWIMMTAGLGMLGYATWSIATDWGTLASESSLQALALPIWLSLGLLPLAILVALLMKWGTAFLRVNMVVDQPASRRRVKVALLAGSRLRAGRIAGFGGGWAKEAADARTFRGALREVTQFVAERKEQQRIAREASERLRRLAGIDGEDDEGRRLDQREFSETQDALRRLSIAEMGWYPRDGRNRYRKELADSLTPRFVRLGLPEDHGVHIEVDSDGQRWFAFRQTITGWYFGIGASEPPPDEWVMDGPEPPVGFPGSDEIWDRPWGDRVLNW